MLAIVLALPGQLGLGDVMFVGAIAFNLGWLGWQTEMLGLLAGLARLLGCLHGTIASDRPTTRRARRIAAIHDQLARASWDAAATTGSVAVTLVHEGIVIDGTTATADSEAGVTRRRNVLELLRISACGRYDEFGVKPNRTRCRLPTRLADPGFAFDAVPSVEGHGHIEHDRLA
ncbi:hypothetical protein ACH4OY_02680 [Micromonospora rubida]|uniref:Uncharacterized protein n=1 Tax=Micromonospora rubida TaxID=2697657 RepID=A0ABW7SD30_9ACTN